jgi:hypothetical protein
MPKNMSLITGWLWKMFWYYPQYTQYYANLEDECKTWFDTKKKQRNTLRNNRVLAIDIVALWKKNVVILPENVVILPGMLSYYQKMSSYYQENRQYYTTSESMTTVLGSIDETKTQYSKFFFDAREKWEDWSSCFKKWQCDTLFHKISR